MAFSIGKVIKLVSKRAVSISGLIMNGILLYETYEKLRDNHPAFNNLVEKIKKEIFNQFSKEKTSVLVRNTMPEVLKDQSISKEEVEMLQDYKYSKILFNVNYPVFRKINSKEEDPDRKIDGKTRYFKEPAQYGDDWYLICNAWREKHKETYLEWLKKVS